MQSYCKEMNERLAALGVVPVVVIEDAAYAEPLAEALMAGGLPAAEVTFRTAAAAEAIARMKKARPELLVGAGTIINVEQAKAALAAGAEFLVSPGYSREVVDFCVEHRVPIYPGCVNASDCMRAVNSGLELLKFFPAEQAGGLPYIKALCSVFPQVFFMPTGGVNAKNLADYLGEKRILACGGSWMVKGQLMKEGRFDEIERLCREAVSLVRELRP